MIPVNEGNALWVWRCELCGTVTYLMGSGPLFTCPCPMEKMTVGLLKDGDYTHIGYVHELTPAEADLIEKREER